MFNRLKCSPVVIVATMICLPAIAGAEPIGVAWRTNVDAAKMEAAQSGRLVLLHFYTQSCMPCKVLEQNVLSQPQVGAAVERSYVPVKVDADAQPGLRNWLKIDRVPTDVVMTPDGNVVATLSTPDTPDAYVAQVENLARHFQQSKAAPGGGPAQAVNAAYSSLPAGPAAPSATNAYAGRMALPAASPSPGNPSMGASPASGVTPPAGALVASRPPSMPPAVMPSNAMPQSYNAPMFGAPQTGAGAAATAGAGMPASRSVGSPVTDGAPTQSVPVATLAGAPPTAPGQAALAVAATQAVMAPPQGATVRTAQSPLPAGTPPVAFDGCCPVTLKRFNKWTPGSTSFGAIHRGRTYLFASDAERQQFLADPDAFSPVFAGYDPVLLLEKQQTVPGTRKFGFRYGDSFYLFSSRETMAKFEASPQTYAAGVRQAMARVDGTPGGLIRR
jgi:protein disulfide-isomerase